MGMRAVHDGALRRRIASCLHVPALLAAGLLALTATSAQAVEPTPSYKPVGSFGAPGAGDGQFDTPRRIAVEPGTGNILVSDSANNRVQVFAPGPTPTFLTAFGTGVLLAPFGIAVDQGSGAVYVADSGHNRILRYTSDGLPTPTYTLDLTFVSPGQGTGAGQIGSFASALAIDPVSHDLLVADAGNRRVSRYTSDGAFIGSFNGAGTVAGAFTGPLDVAVSAAGVTYVVDASGVVDNTGTSRLERFDAGGASLGRLTGPGGAQLIRPRAVAIDPASDRLVATANTSRLDSPKRLFVFAGGTAPLAQIDFPVAFRSTLVGLAIDEDSGRLYALGDRNVLNQGAAGVQVLDPYPIPGVELGPTSAITATGAHVTGTVAPGGVAATARFEYSNDGATWSATPDQPVSGAGEVPVAADLTGLEPNTPYSLRLVAANDTYSATTPSGSFSTSAVPPGVTTGPASDRTTRSATLHGAVVPFGDQTTYHFEYGETTAYGQRAPAAVDGVAGNGRTTRNVSRGIAGLQPATTYHYRLVAQNATGTASGDDATFTTRAASEPVRAYEMVTPVDKGGAALNTEVGFQARRAGDAIVWQTRNTVDDPGTGSAPVQSRYLSTRGADDWAFRALDAPQLQGQLLGTRLYFTLAVSEDGSRELVPSNRALAPGGVDGDGNLYLRDLEGGSYTLVATSPDPFFYQAITGFGGAQTLFLGGADDFSWIVFWSPFALTPDATPGVSNVYRWSAAGLELVSRLQDGSAPPSGGAAEGRGSLPEARFVSDDGSRIFYTLGGGPADGVYVRIGGADPTPISVSQRPGDPSTPVPAQFVSASPDGRYAVFLVPDAGAPLTPDAPGDPNTMYRYDVETGDLTYLVGGIEYGSPDSILAVSDAADHVYYEGSGARGLEVWHDGAVETVTDVTPAQRTASPSGRYFAFASTARLTAYDNLDQPSCFDPTTGARDCIEVYLYDAQTDQLSCASCPADSGRPNGHARLGDPTLELSGYFPQHVTDDGTVYFDTATPLVAWDANGTRDVYAYRDGEARLISRGAVGTSSHFADASPDGRDVFFITDDRLVGRDTDAEFDMYDARLGGGLPSQVAPARRAPCGGTECREPGAGPVSAPPAGSEGAGGDDPRVVRPRRARVSIAGVVVGAKAIRLTVRTSGRGQLRAAGRGVATTRRAVAAAGLHRLEVPLTKRTRAARRDARRVRVRITVRLTPPFGARATDRMTRTLERRGAAR